MPKSTTQRHVVYAPEAEKLDKSGVVDILVRYITGDDPAGYLARITEQYAKEKGG